MHCLFCLFIVDNLFAGIVYDPRSKGLVTSNKPGVLQFYLPQSDHHAFSVSYLPEIILMKYMKIELLLHYLLWWRIDSFVECCRKLCTLKLNFFF